MMSREERAKQFAPFEALTGLRKALAKKEAEHERVEKIEVSEDRAARLDRTIAKLEPGMTVRVTYYSGGGYVDVTGKLAAVDSAFFFLKIGNGKIFFDDIYEITIIDGVGV